MNPPVIPSACIRSRLPHGLLALCLLLPVAPVWAQTADPAKPATGDTTEQPPTGEVVQLDKFTVTAAIDTYHQASSDMATKIPMDTMDLASSLSILNSTAISDRNAVALTDVFNYVVGATQSQTNINGFSFRGFPNTGSYTQNIQFDGLQGATLKKASTSAADVDSLEFLKGPNGVLYGQMNPGGLLNIVTKNPEEVQHTNLRLSYAGYAGSLGSDNFTQDLSIDTTGPVFNSKHLFYRLVVDAASVPTSRPTAKDRGISLYPSLTYKWSKDTSFTVKVESSQDRRHQDDGLVPIFNGPTIPVIIGGVSTQTAAYGAGATWYSAPLNTVYQDAADWATDRGEALSTFFKTQIADWTLRVQSRAVWHVDQVNEWTINNANVFSPTAKYATPTSTLRRQYNDVKNGHRYDFFDANIYRAFGPENFRNTVMFGAGGGGEAFYNVRIAFGPNATLPQAITLIDPVLNQYTWPAAGTGASNQVTWQTALGEYFSDQIKIGKKLHVSLGIRHDLQKVHGLNLLTPATTAFWNKISAYTKSAGAVYDLTPSLAVYGSWSQSIKPQTTIAYDASGNSSFPPETGMQYEGGFKFQTPSKNLNLTIASYEINRQNVVVPSGTNFTAATLPPGTTAVVGQAISRLDGEQTSKGVEIELQWQPFSNWQISTGYAHSVATISKSITNPQTIGLDLANAPRDTGNVWTRYNIPKGALKGLGFGLGVIYVGPAFDGDPTTAVYFQMPGWTRVDCSAYYKWKNLDFALNMQNALDRTYISSATSAIELNPGEQRKITFSMGMKF